MNLRYGGTRMMTLVLVGAVSVLSGCGSGEESTKKATAAATKAASPVPDELVGTWVGRLGPSPNGNFRI